MNILKVFLVGLAGMIMTFQGFSQVSVNTTGTPADPSAMMDISSTDKGLLIPRVTLTSYGDNITPINNPARGLLVYNINSPLSEGFYVWTGMAWSALASTEYVNNTTLNAIQSMAFGEIYEFNAPGSYTPVTLTSNGSWVPWATGITGDTNLISTAVNGGIKQFFVESGGYYEVTFESGVQAQSGGAIIDAAIFRNDTVQNDLRGRTEFREGNSTQSLNFTGIIHLEPGDVIDVRFSGNQNKDLRLETVNLTVHQLE